MTPRSEVEYLLDGLEQELRDGLARLERADQASDHVEFYRRSFDRYVVELRRELDCPTPDPNQIAVCAMQAAWLAHIWPVLQSSRLQWRGPDNLKPSNNRKQTAARDKQHRCSEIAATLVRPTPNAIAKAYKKQFPDEPAPSATSIRRYLATAEK